MKISKLVQLLNEQKERYGDINIALSSDEEGNSFHNVSTWFGGAPDNKKPKYLVIYPEHEMLDI